MGELGPDVSGEAERAGIQQKRRRHDGITTKSVGEGKYPTSSRLECGMRSGPPSQKILDPHRLDVDLTRLSLTSRHDDG